MATKNFDIVKLYFPKGIQLSNGKGEHVHNFDYLHSDTLKAALLVNAIQLFGNSNIDNLRNLFAGISSAFPFYNNTLFFPKPFLKLPFELKNDSNLSIANKKLKQIRFVDKDAFEKIVFNVQTFISDGNLSNNGKFLSLSQSIRSKIYTKASLQKVHIEEYALNGNYTRESTPYYIELIEFHPQAGLYFILEKGVITNEFEAALKLLADNGIGGDKTHGYGTFNYEIIKDGLSFNTPEKADGYINLSLFCPTQDEVNEISLNDASYELVKRGGYIANPEQQNLFAKRKKSIYMFSEGSAFAIQTNLKGKQVNIAPDNAEHPVWRCGQSVFIPFVK